MISAKQATHLQFSSPSPQHTLVFSLNSHLYALSYVQYSSPLKSFTIRYESQIYQCNFFRFVSLQYASQLKRLLSLMDRQVSRQFVKQYWLALYQIDCKIFMREKGCYVIGDIGWGQSIFVRNIHSYQRRTCSNCFKMKQRHIYWIDNQGQEYVNTMDEVISLDQEKIYGVIMKANKINICIPMKVVLEDNTTPFVMVKDVQRVVGRVVYLNYKGNVATGTLVDQNMILTVKHLFNTEGLALGDIVRVRRFPYNQHINAKLVKFHQKLDLALLQLINTQQSIQFDQKNKQKQQKYPYKADFNRPQIATPVLAFGFGKYPYSQPLFSQLPLLLPTIARGIVSKTIPSLSPIFFKTDLYLYNGFSGCSIWTQEGQLGVAVFILKSAINGKNHNRHNFSLVLGYIRDRFMGDNDKKVISRQEGQFLGKMDAVTTRQKIIVIPKL